MSGVILISYGEQKRLCFCSPQSYDCEDSNPSHDDKHNADVVIARMISRNIVSDMTPA